MGNKIACGMCNIYNDVNIDKKESIIIIDINEKDQFKTGTSLNQKSTLIEKTKLIQKHFRKFKSLKFLKKNFLQNLASNASLNDTNIYATTKQNFIFNLDVNILEVISKFMGIDDLENLRIESFFKKIKTFSSKINPFNKKSFRINLDPVIITDKNDRSEIYWGDWNINFQKHGLGILISTKQDFYIGNFTNNIMDGIGILVINKLKNFKDKNNNFHKISNQQNSEENNDYCNSNSLGNILTTNNINNTDTETISNNKVYSNENVNSNTIISPNSSSKFNFLNKSVTDSNYNKETYFKTIELGGAYDLSKVEDYCKKIKKENKSFKTSIKKGICESKSDEFINSYLSDFSKNIINNYSQKLSNEITNLNKSQTGKDKLIFSEEKINSSKSDNNIKATSLNNLLPYELYIGEFRDGFIEGYGRLFSCTGEWYIGFFKNNQKNGEGKINFADGSFFIGSFKNNLFEGEGIYYFKDGSNYKGNFKQNKFHGYGKMYWSDGRVYNGLWENGLMNGIGTHIWNNGNFFEGTYKNNVKNNKGRYYWDENKFFEGEFLNNKINGKGIFNFNNNKFRGCCKFGKVNFISDLEKIDKAFTFESLTNNVKPSEFKIRKANYKEEKYYEIDHT